MMNLTFVFEILKRNKSVLKLKRFLKYFKLDIFKLNNFIYKFLKIDNLN